ncbi:GxxExxY protein [Flavobacterium filum]|uniref:GxxExxY protein n=1 Tax=Flavobacterium TaxID=237 RepID=UPI00040EBE42|nr:GxxExxY protein [Flavobacterium filum]
MENNELTYEIRSAIFEVFKELGPGLLESIYEAALCYELEVRGFEVKCQLNLPVIYKNKDLGLGYRLDVLVNDSIIIEIKSVEEVKNVHKKQLLTYLKLTNKKLGLLVNFNADYLKDKESIIRIIN